MANFTFEKYNSMPEQVEENKHNIKELINIIKDAYTCDIELNNLTVSVAKTNTNADASVVDGWLFDTVGSLFKITGGDDTTLLLKYYTSFRGIQGEQGEQGPQGEPGDATIDDNNISLSPYTWSSKKINDELDIIKNDIDYTLLWQNANPNVAFNETHNIQIATLQDYEFIVVAFKYVGSLDNGVEYRKFKLNTNYGSVGSISYVGASYFGRAFGTDSSTEVYFGKAYISNVENNNYLIPMAIYGINIM